MRTYIIKRLLLMIPTLLTILIVSYAIMRMAPGTPDSMGRSSLLSAGEAQVMTEGESEAAKTFSKYFALDKPWYVGFWYWLNGNPEIETSHGVFRGDFGVSVTISLGTPVWKLLRERLPATIKLNLLALAVVYLVAIPFGVYSAVKRGSTPDKVISLVFFLLYSLPSFWVALLLIIFAAKYVPWWPVYGLESNLPATASYWKILGDTALHYVLPVFCLSYGGFAGLSRYARSGMLEVISQDYIRTARAKGLSEWRVIMVHAFRNSLIPLVTLMAGLLPGMIGGSAVIEYIFSINGMGSLAINAIGQRDYPVLITVFGFSALLTLVGILVSDILYKLVDPRITFDKK